MFNTQDSAILCAFFASMLWQDGDLDGGARDALATFASELRWEADDPRLLDWSFAPPEADEIDPTLVPRHLTHAVLAACTLAASITPSLQKYETLELLEALLPAPLAEAPELIAA